MRALRHGIVQLARGASAVALLIGAACSPAAPVAPTAAPAQPAAQAPAQAAPAAPATSNGQQLLKDLVQQANQEGELVATIQSSWNKAVIPTLSEAFKKRFGLTINVSLTNEASAKHFPIAVAETQSGAPATYDVVQGDDAETMQLTSGGGVATIANWEALLKEVNPLVSSGGVTPDHISRGPFAGHSFLFMDNIKQIVYNPNQIKESELPKTHPELTDPKYQGKFVQPPWTSHWEIAPVALGNLDKEKWLDTVRAAGKNTGEVMGESGGVQLVAAGKYAFVLAQDTYVNQAKAKDANAPIAAKYFTDYNELNGVYYSVRTRAKHPAAGTLWALWMTTPEAEAIWQPSELQGFIYGTSELDKAQSKVLKAGDAKIVSFLDDEKTTALLQWYQTPDGAKYLEAMAKAIKGE